MSARTRPGWERFGDAMLEWGGYVLLGLATFIGISAGSDDTVWRVTSLAIAATGCAWLYVMYTLAPAPRVEQRVRMRLFFVGLLAFAALLMLRHPLFFPFMIAGFFYATVLRPLSLAVVGVGTTSVLINTLIAGIPKSPEAWTWWIVIVGIQTLVISAGVVMGEKVSEQSEQRREALDSLEAALTENAGLQAQLVTQAREAGVLEERQRMAREIHDTLAQGLTGIITQLEAADAARTRPLDRDRHLDNAQRLARESLTEARRSVEASMPSALETATLPEALTAIARQWSDLNAVPVDVTITGDVIALQPDVEIALLRTAQEALANVAKHASATRAGLTLSYMSDVVALDVRDDGVGFSPSDRPNADGSGFGLSGMRQRVARVAGSLAIESEPGGGTAISARVPAIAATAFSPTAS
jgi:signal transduction histidine kinase